MLDARNFSTGFKEGELFEFLVRMSGQQMTSCTPDTCNIRRFLVWKVKVKFVRQIVFLKKTPNKWLFACSFPVRLASGTVSLINRLMNIFDEMGFGRSWNMALGLRNTS